MITFSILKTDISVEMIIFVKSTGKNIVKNIALLDILAVKTSVRVGGMHLKDNDMKECLKRLPYVAVLRSYRYPKSALEILNQLLCFYPFSPNKSTKRHVQK